MSSLVCPSRRRDWPAPYRDALPPGNPAPRTATRVSDSRDDRWRQQPTV